MGCLNDTKLLKESAKAGKLWENSPAIKAWGFSEDFKTFDRMFDTVTGKEHIPSTLLEASDYKKMQVAISKLEKDLTRPGILSSKLIQHIFVGKSISQKNPILKDFFEEVNRAGQYRNSHSQPMMTHFQEMISELKLAIIDFDGGITKAGGQFSKGKLQLRNLSSPTAVASKRKAKKAFEKLDKMESAYVRALGKRVHIGTNNEFKALSKFFENEGSAFQDVMDVINSGNNIVLKKKYKIVDNKGNLISDPMKAQYITRITKAAGAWKQIQELSKDHLIKSISTQESTIKLKFGDSKQGIRLAEEYSKIRLELEKFEGEYIPHYVLDLLGQSLEISETMAGIKPLDFKTQQKEIDNKFTQFVKEAEQINTRLSDRLKHKQTGKTQEYFSRNPMLYAQKYISQVVNFNHNAHIDNAYTKGLKKLSEVIFQNPDTPVAEAAKVYKNIFLDVYGAATKKDRVDQSSTASNITRLVTSLQFTAKLGFSTRGALRNATQRFLNFAYFGGLAQIDAIAALRADDKYAGEVDIYMKKHGFKFGDISQATEGAVSKVDLIGNGIQTTKDGHLTRTDMNVLQKLVSGTSKVAEYSSVLTRWAENSNRASTFKVGFHQRSEQLKLSDKYVNWATDTKVKEQMYTRAADYAAKMVTLLHFEYSPHAKAKWTRTGLGAVAGQFQHYAMSFAQLQWTMLRDYGRAAKAGQFAGPEAGRIIRMFMLYAMTNAISGVFDTDFTTYVSNDTVSRMISFSKFFSDDPEVQKEAFYGKGLVGATGIVPLSDIVEIHNLGVAAGYWKMLADPESTTAWLTGMREYEKIDNWEFGGEFAGMFSIQGDRLVRRTIPAAWNQLVGNASMEGIIRAELGLYPGTTELGVKTRDLRNVYIEGLGKTVPAEYYQNIPAHLKGGYGKGLYGTKGQTYESLHNARLTTRERARALKALNSLY